ncbi:hypothetical protein DFH28DRAFT_945890 [Melampsora americana]|nr:hypothetical protein DFH28DRAFT_945890 [Melampsora americana]
MVNYLYLIDTLLIASISHVIGVSVDGSLDMRTTPSISELKFQPFNIASDSEDAARITVDQATRSFSTPFDKKQKRLDELSHLPVNANGSRAMKRKSTLDLNLPYDVSSGQDNARVAGKPTKKSHLLIDPSVKQQHDVDIQELLDLPRNVEESKATKRKLTLDLNLPYDISWTETGNELFENQQVTDQIEESTGISQHVEVQPALADSSSSISKARPYRRGGPSTLRRYTFLNSGESALLHDYRVRKIGDRWHMMPMNPDIAFELKQRGMKLAIEQRLHPRNAIVTPWFHTLERDMQSIFCHETESQEDSMDIHLAILRANKYFTMQFLASLQVIHSPSPKELKELISDGWNFVQNFLESWRQFKWNGTLIKTIDTSKCLGTYTPFEIFGHFLKTPRSSRLSLCFSWSLCNDWYNVSTYKKKKRISFDDYFLISHQHLVEANLFPELEVVPCSTSDILQSQRPSLDEIRRENVSVGLNQYKRAVTMMNKVGEPLLKELLDEGFSLGFIDHYCNYMGKQEIKWPHSWKGNLNSLNQKVKTVIFPCFIGMIQLLHPFNNKRGEINPAVIKGFKFLKKTLKGWGENDLKRASQIKNFNVKHFHKFHEEISIPLLLHLMQSNPLANSMMASIWERKEGFKFSDFIIAIMKAYANRV